MEGRISRIVALISGSSLVCSLAQLVSCRFHGFMFPDRLQKYPLHYPPCHSPYVFWALFIRTELGFNQFLCQQGDFWENQSKCCMEWKSDCHWLFSFRDPISFLQGEDLWHRRSVILATCCLLRTVDLLESVSSRAMFDRTARTGTGSRPCSVPVAV